MENIHKIQKISNTYILKWLLLILGLLISGIGVAITKKGELGVSPVSSVANILSIRFSALTLGNWLIIWNCILILGQVLVLGKKFKVFQLLQIPLSFLFGYFTDFGTWIASVIPTDMYVVRLLCVVVGTIVLGFGISITVTQNIIMNSGEAFVKAVADTFNLEFGNVKTGFDISCVLISIILSLILCDMKVLGTREGTIIAAIFTGVCVKFFLKLYKK